MTTVADLARECRMDKHKFYEWARREDDPLPLRRFDGMKRSSVILVDEWNDWFKRNSKLFREVQDD